MPSTRRHARRRPGSAGAVVAGVLGEVLLTLGVVLALFVVWQLWWTSVVAGREADAVVDAFRQAVPAAAAAETPLRTDDPPVAEPVAHGGTIGVLTVPRWEGLTNNAMPVVEGTSQDLLDRALAGRYSSTQQLGEVGNTVLAGHRRSYGDSFRYVNRLEPGDPIIVETATTWYVYEVTGDEIVTPDTTDVLLPVPRQPGVEPTERTLTLTTCHSLTLGEYGNDHRWITYARFVGWLDRADGTPPQLREGTA
ncbi:class E sortase [Cellulomonas triticagri]|uniref:Class E sortase n=1 Tax=Cellulomonas triticagri TaxID=2483352 RepID=A0A3M2JR20_9CELL|nr:class E sortase [Cellulomonas triticagri]RMI14103.1 class E sortase [Cellulomonas triticagri]